MPDKPAITETLESRLLLSAVVELPAALDVQAFSGALRWPLGQVAASPADLAPAAMAGFSLARDLLAGLDGIRLVLNDVAPDDQIELRIDGQLYFAGGIQGRTPSDLGQLSLAPGETDGEVVIDIAPSSLLDDAAMVTLTVVSPSEVAEETQEIPSVFQFRGNRRTWGPTPRRGLRSGVDSDQTVSNDVSSQGVQQYQITVDRSAYDASPAGQVVVVDEALTASSLTLQFADASFTASAGGQFTETAELAGIVQQVAEGHAVLAAAEEQVVEQQQAASEPVAETEMPADQGDSGVFCIALPSEIVRAAQASLADVVGSDATTSSPSDGDVAHDAAAETPARTLVDQPALAPVEGEFNAATAARPQTAAEAEHAEDAFVAGAGAAADENARSGKVARSDARMASTQAARCDDELVDLPRAITLRSEAAGRVDQSEARLIEGAFDRRSRLWVSLAVAALSLRLICGQRREPRLRLEPLPTDPALDEE